MRPLRSPDLHGVWGTVLLPLVPGGEIDWPALENQVDALVAGGLSGVYTNGTAGEFLAQSEDEFDRLSRIVAERCGAAGVPFQIGVSHASPRLALDRLRRSIRLRPGAVQVALPDWPAMSAPEAVAFLRRLAAEAGEIGIVLYNPPHARRVLEPREWTALRRHVPTLIGVKVGDETPGFYAAMRRDAEALAVFVPGHHLATGLRHGAHGSYSNLACLSPAAARRFYELASEDLDAALALERRIRELFAEHLEPLLAGYCDAAVDKLLAVLGGWAPLTTELRWPYRGIPPEHVERLRPIFRERLPEFTSADGRAIVEAARGPRPA